MSQQGGTTELTDILKAFMAESDENLTQVDQDLILIESCTQPEDIQQAIQRIFRAIHTIKGSCGWLGLSRMEQVSHAGENLLSVLRDGKIAVNSMIISALLATVDAIREIFSNLHQTGQEGAKDYQELTQLLLKLQQPEPEEPVVSLQTIAMNDVLQAFIGESYENLVQVDQDLILLENNPGSDEQHQAIQRIFRTIHTIKGSCGWLGLTKMEHLSHSGENLLSELRDGHIKINPTIVSALLATLDGIRHIFSSIENENTEGTQDFTALIQQLQELQRQDPSATEATPIVLNTQPVESIPTPEQALLVTPPQTNVPAPAKIPATEVKSSQIADSNIRVNVNILDKLMNLVGELVLTRNQMLQLLGSLQNRQFASSCQRLNLITTELQENIMQTRMQPIGHVWNTFPRVVRDLAMSLGKKIQLDMEGKDTELDKTLVEAIKDPLTHIVRNSVDHGIEVPAVRQQRGKPEEGLLCLKAYHEGGQVIIEIVDDGGGIDSEKLKHKALQKELISQSQASQMSERDLLNLIFLPGFSTAEQVTNISGRGVGMDVVRTNIEKIGGTIDILSVVNEGTTFRIKIPLTLAIIPALIVTADGDRFAIPQVNLQELVSLQSKEQKQDLEFIDGIPIYRLRQHLLPLVNLRQSLDLSVESLQKQLESDMDAINIVVLQISNQQFGLIVDEINDTEEIVVKPLGPQLRHLSSFAGATIMGDGHISLILDVMGLAQQANVLAQMLEDYHLSGDGLVELEEETEGNLLLFTLGGEHIMAMPLSMVSRLEDIDVSQVEWVGRQRVIQYRGKIMPLVHLSAIIPECEELTVTENAHKTGKWSVIVYNVDQHHQIGLVVGEILDIVEEYCDLQPTGQRFGVLGSAIIQNRVTEFIDIPTVIQTLNIEILNTVALVGAK